MQELGNAGVVTTVAESSRYHELLHKDPIICLHLQHDAVLSHKQKL